MSLFARLFGLKPLESAGRKLSEAEREKLRARFEVLQAKRAKGPIVQGGLPERTVLTGNKSFAVSWVRADARAVPEGGLEFEHWSANVLRVHGWKVNVTPGSGDYGADLVAEAGQIRVVVQCKRYSSPVGNAAVQEVFSAKAFYEATHAVVVATAGFTKAAQTSAQKLGVILMEHTELERLSDLLSSTSAG